MRVLGKKRNKVATQQGFSLFELLVVIAIVGLILAAVAGVFMQVVNGTRTIAAKTVMQQHTRIFLQDCRETISGAGTSALNLAGDRLLIRDNQKRNQPAAFISEDGKTLTAIQTDRTGEAKVITGVGTDKLYLTHAEWQRWQSVLPYSYVMAVNPVGPPAFLQLSSTPEQVGDGEIPAELGKYSPDRTIRIRVQPVAELGGLTPLTNIYTESAKIIPIVRIVRYFADGDGIERAELETVNQEATGIRPAATFYTTAMTPGMKSKIEFRYVTTAGQTQELPDDLNSLRGIRIKTMVTDPDTKFTQEDSYDVTVSEWR